MKVVNNIKCKRVGLFKGDTVVSISQFMALDEIKCIQICSRFTAVYGEQVDLGDAVLVDINDINTTVFGDSVTIKENEMPLFLACCVMP